MSLKDLLSVAREILLSGKEPEHRCSSATSMEGELVRLEARAACEARRNPARRSRDGRNVVSDAVGRKKIRRETKI